MKKAVIITAAVLAAVICLLAGAAALLPGRPAYIAAKTFYGSGIIPITEYEHYDLTPEQSGIKTIKSFDFSIDVSELYALEPVSEASGYTDMYKKEDEAQASLLLRCLQTQEDAQQFFSDDMYIDGENGVDATQSAQKAALMRTTFEEQFGCSAAQTYNCIKAARGVTLKSFKLSERDQCDLILSLMSIAYTTKEDDAVYYYMETPQFNGILSEVYYPGTGRTLVELNFYNAAHGNACYSASFICQDQAQLLTAYRAFNSISFE